MTILGRFGDKLIGGTALGASITAAEKRGFGVHALEVWQKGSHVKRTGECHRRQRQTPEKFRYMLTGLRLFLKYSLRKNLVENFLSDPGERSAFFVASWIKVYIIIIMGHLVLSIFHEFFDNFIGIFRKNTFNF